MKMKKFELFPDDQDEKKISDMIKGSVYVETYTYDHGGYHGRHNLVIFAFYPDEGSQENKIKAMYKR